MEKVAKAKKMGERTQDIYEQLPHYPKPPLAPLPDPDDLRSWADIGVVDSPLSRGIIRVASRLIGFHSFQRQLPDHLEGLLRRVNLRGAGLFALVNSASLAIKNDTRNPDALTRAATLILAARSFYRDLWRGKLKPDTYRDQILEMGQYPNLFSTCLTIDENGARLFKSSATSQIAVVVQGQYFLLEVGDIDSDPALETLVRALRQIVQLAKQEATDGNLSPGILTSVKHGTQLKIFRRFLQNPVNRESFSRMRHVFLTLCLDLEDQPQDEAEAAHLAHVGNLSNRWYHSSVQIVVFGNARASVICNFNTYIAGNPMMRFSAELYDRAAAVPLDGNRVRQEIPKPEKLNWVVEENWLKLAERDVQWVAAPSPATFQMEAVGQDAFLAWNLKPVPVFVVALQMAMQRLINRKVRIYQYLTMSRYRCLDLAIAMVATPQVNAAVDYLLGQTVEKDRAIQLLNDAITSQQSAARQARQQLSMQKIFSLFLTTRKPLQKAYVMTIGAFVYLLLRLFGLYKPQQLELVLSHPSIFPQVPVVGRPGIRLPYVRYFGLHYQIWKDKIVTTIMPGLRWKITNEQLVAEIKQNLEKILNLLQEGELKRDPKRQEQLN